MACGWPKESWAQNNLPHYIGPQRCEDFEISCQLGIFKDDTFGEIEGNNQNLCIKFDKIVVIIGSK